MVLGVLCSLLCVSHLSQGFDVMRLNQRLWSYELISFTSTTSDENLFKSNVDMTYLARNEYALSGTVNMNFDIVEGDNNMVEGVFYRSATGSSAYTPTPFGMPKQHDISFINTFYREFKNNGFRTCTDLPKFEGPFKPPFEKKIYTVDKCLITFPYLPFYMLDGYYKLIITHTGVVNFTLEVFGKMEYDN